MSAGTVYAKSWRSAILSAYRVGSSLGGGIVLGCWRTGDCSIASVNPSLGAISTVCSESRNTASDKSESDDDWSVASVRACLFEYGQKSQARFRSGVCISGVCCADEMLGILRTAASPFRGLPIGARVAVSSDAQKTHSWFPTSQRRHDPVALAPVQLSFRVRQRSHALRRLRSGSSPASDCCIRLYADRQEKTS